jgi:putative Mg2+ transporter-C (MgtC) family protein
MQHEEEGRVEGLTTAASIWVAAALGMACGAGLVELVLIGLGAVLLVMVGGEPVERMLTRGSKPPPPGPDGK